MLNSLDRPSLTAVDNIVGHKNKNQLTCLLSETLSKIDGF